MRGMKMLVVGAMLVAGAASAQDEAAASEVSGSRFSVGAGLGFVIVGNNGSLGGLTSRASIEYLLADDLALIAGASGNVGVSWDETDESSLEGGVGVNVGLRKFLSGSGPTRLSVHGVLNTGFRDSENAAATSQFGVSGGFAVDRQLIEALTLRAGVELVNLGYSRNVGSLGNAGTKRLGLDLFIAPSLELRLAF